MADFDKIFSFQNLYKAHLIARKGKRFNNEVLNFELNLGNNITLLSDSLKNGTYEMSGYYSFVVHDPKDRVIHALHYKDRVVQHCLCDEILAPTLDKKLIYDNSACRVDKGTYFAIYRLSKFMCDYYKKNKNIGYFLKCDIRKFFDNINHDILKKKLREVFTDERLLALLYQIIDSYEKLPGKGLPLGNQTSQWFAIYYLDGFDRLIKEKLHIRYYSRYMDDCVLIHSDKNYLKSCLLIMDDYLLKNLDLSFNEKTKIFPLKNGVNYLGWHFYMNENGKIMRKVKQSVKNKYRRKLKYFKKAYARNKIEIKEINQVINSYNAHLSFGHTYKIKDALFNDFVLSNNKY